jgi:formamidopyrimidine-DNA glycosylase
VPELPEVETVVRTLQPSVEGRTIRYAEFHSPHVTPGDRAALASSLTGRRIENLVRYGKYLLFQLDYGYWLVHLGMTGKLLVGAPRTPHTHAWIELDDRVLVYDDVRQFGHMEWAAELPPRLRKLGPDPLEIDADSFARRLRARRSRLKPLLLNQAFLRGLGNIYVDEALFQARLHPLRVANRVPRRQAGELHQAIQELLALAIRYKGSSISDYVDAAGERGSFQELHQVYGREGAPCPRCGTLIRRMVVTQRGTHYCPRCQPRR